MDKSDEDTEWEKEMGVVIDLAKESDYPEIQAVVHSHFYMEEPTQYSMEMGTGTGVFDRIWKWMCDDYMIKEPLRKNKTNPACLVARSSESGKVIGVRLGEVVDRDTFQQGTIHQGHGMRFERIEKWPTFVPVSRRLRKWSNWTNLETKFNFGHDYIFNIPETSGSQRLYLDNLVCVTPEARGKGVGCELVKRAGKLATKSKCSHTYAIATTTGSQKIFERLGYQTILELKYSDYEKDLKGRPFLSETFGHACLKVVLLEN